MRRLLAIIGTTAMLMVGILVVPTAASAADYETDYVVPTTTPIVGPCLVIQEAEGCFKEYGDQWSIRSWTSGTVRVEWQNQLWDGSQWVLYRIGGCISNLGYGQSGVCNKDYYESSSRNYFGSYGSRIRWSTCAPTCSGWGTWVNNNS
ncbi:hypothetical protein [Micromonospora sp. NPDC004704]